LLLGGASVAGGQTAPRREDGFRPLFDGASLRGWKQKMKAPDYDPKATLELIGRSGHIELEVRDNDPRMGADRWAPGELCRWRNISIKKF
jgi:hypothetical protein